MARETTPLSGGETAEPDSRCSICATVDTLPIRSFTSVRLQIARLARDTPNSWSLPSNSQQRSAARGLIHELMSLRGNP
jgi:hypothetical protein